jgi:TolA-binding protein
MRRALAALILAAPLLLPVAADPAWAQAESREGIYLQNQILQLRQELDQLRRGGSSLGAPAQVAPPRGGAAAGPQGEILGALLDRVSALEDETRRLRGRLEESEYRDRTLGQTVEKLQGDIDYRLQQLEGQPAAGRPAAPVAAPTSPAPARPPAATPPPIAARPPERAIADGQAALNRRDYAAAEAAAREALAVRGSPRTTDAQLLLGDALTGKRDFAGAALAYNDAFTRGRTGPRAPEALLGLAGAFTNLGNKREACETLDDLRSNFPNLRGALAERSAESRRRAGCR